MTPLERAARVLFTRDPGPYADCVEWAIEQEFGWRDRVDDARAVIEAIREPSEAMELAGYGNSKGDPDNTGIVDNPRPDEAWPAMIDALLEEGRGK